MVAYHNYNHNHHSCLQFHIVGGVQGIYRGTCEVEKRITITIPNRNINLSFFFFLLLLLSNTTVHEGEVCEVPVGISS